MKIEDFEFINEQDMKIILLDQARQIEGQKFQHNIYKPNKLAQDNQAYLDWQQKGLIIDQSLKAVKKAINEAGFTVEEVLSAVEGSTG